MVYKRIRTYDSTVANRDPPSDNNIISKPNIISYHARIPRQLRIATCTLIQHTRSTDPIDVMLALSNTTMRRDTTVPT